MAPFRVVIVGRPNVGKSSLFNWLAGLRLAIVDDVAGVTRDRLTQAIQHEGRWFEIVDTGGIGIQDADNLGEAVERQIQRGIESADLLLFVVDAKSGSAPLDDMVAQRLRRSGRPVVLVANKADTDASARDAAEFCGLGFGPPLLTSVTTGRGKEVLLRAITASVPGCASPEPAPEPIMKVAIVGRRNVGKSTFINTLLAEERMIVSDVPGTTRDSVDVRFELDGKAFVAIDTPGLKRSSRLQEDLEFYSLHRAQRAIRRADVALIFFDAAEKITNVDKQLVDYVDEQGKPCIFVINKWDLLAKSVSTEEWGEYLRAEFPSMAHVPLVFITGRTGKNVKALLNHAQMLFSQARRRVETGLLNRLLEEAFARNAPPVYRHRRPKVYFATQVGVCPPSIVLFCNEPRAFSPSYRRYLVGYLRDRLAFAEVPIRLQFRRKGEGRKPAMPSGPEAIRP